MLQTDSCPPAALKCSVGAVPSARCAKAGVASRRALTLGLNAFMLEGSKECTLSQLFSFELLNTQTYVHAELQRVESCPMQLVHQTL